jgi:hypothetical protein
MAVAALCERRALQIFNQTAAVTDRRYNRMVVLSHKNPG